MRSRHITTLLFAGVVLTVATVLVASACGSSRRGNSADAETSRGWGISNAGKVVPTQRMPGREIAFLSDLKVDPGSVRELSERGGTRYYVGTSANSARCYITGTVLGPDPHFGIGSCVRTDPDRPDPSQPTFPSRERPVLDRSVIRQGPVNGPIRGPVVVRFSGFAADGVDAVGIVDSRGSIHWTSVVDNVYNERGWEPFEAKGIVARDAAGNEIYRLMMP